ncbi:MAG: hypothetical protein BWY82_02560 [Verrucomicrobia bacterium ADurb.Bin474]|nr:MAG: hypothetical protein BWY82_02560 [Verrucomicrobia bacterium ADurb.Bin474]
MVTMLMISFWAAFSNRSVTPHSRIMLPMNSIAIKGAASGVNNKQNIITPTAKTSFSVLLTGRSLCMRILRSAWVVKNRMTGGWIIGTRAM